MDEGFLYVIGQHAIARIDRDRHVRFRRRYQVNRYTILSKSREGFGKETNFVPHTYCRH